MYDNSVKQNETLTALLDKKKNEYDQQIERNEELHRVNSEQIQELKQKVRILSYHSMIYNNRKKI